MGSLESNISSSAVGLAGVISLEMLVVELSLLCWNITDLSRITSQSGI